MKCLICHSDKISIIGTVETSGHYEVARCKACHFVFTLPRPTPEELIAHYSADYFTNSSREAGYVDYYLVGEMNMKAMWPSFKDYAKLKEEDKKTILDVGCASGAFLAEAEHDGWKTKGIELSEDAVGRAKSEYHLDVMQGDIFDERLEAGAFDVVTMWHVLEHTIDPMEVLQRAHDLLTPTGLLFIELPNWNSLGRLIKGTKWKQLVPPAHLNFFVRESMRYALQHSGFEVIRCSTQHIVGFDVLKSRSPKPIVPLLSGFEAAVVTTGCGGYLRALARKKMEGSSLE